jgi:uncharacterized protein YbjT (DUF2867 family)
MARVLLAGATGLIGGAFVAYIANSGHDLHILGRREAQGVPANTHQHIAASADWPAIIGSIKADVAISCLGTTMRIAGSKEAFAAVDLDLVRAFALAAYQAGARHFIGVSSVGADPASSNFYLKTKGQAEQGVSALGFERVDFLRPGLLRGTRGGTFRSAEALGMLISPMTDLLLMGPLRKYRSILAHDVACALARLVGVDGRGRFIHENDAILTLAG